MKKVGLALSGGGARGYAHLGVLKVLDENSIPVDFIAGTSAGSFVGGAYATGLPTKEIIEIGRRIGWLNVVGFSYSPRGVLSNAAMGKLIETTFPVTRFEDLAIPYAAVACDLETGEEVVFKDEGDLAFAIRASCAVPGVFMPVKNGDGRQLVDGGVVSPVPTKVVKRMGADIVIAVDLMACGSTFRSVPRTLLGTFMLSAMTLLRTASRHQHYRADIVIEPQIAHLRPDEIRKREELIDLGEQAALEKLDEIKSLLNQPPQAD